jgi:hypothetical protein
MSFYSRQPRDASAMGPRSSDDDFALPLIVTIGIVAIVFAGLYFFSSEPTRVADTSAGPAMTRPIDPTAPPIPKTQHEKTRPTPAPIP